jgi:hypothetical protein
VDFDDLPNSWKLVELNIVIKEIYRYPNFYGMEHLNQGVPVISLLFPLSLKRVESKG